MNHRPPKLDKLLSVACDTAMEAGQFLAENLDSSFLISKKGPINLVTEMDLRSEDLIIQRLSSAFPGHQILTEEEGSSATDSSYKWIIDPLDGTTNFAHGYRFFSVSIGLEYQGELVLGVVYDPVTRELFSASRGRGAFLNGKSIRVSTETQLGESLLCTGFSYGAEEIQQNLSHFNRLILMARALRRDGSAALDLCYVAAGRFDGFWEISLKPWDVAAGMLIVEEAGGRVTRFDGSGCDIYSGQTLATNGRIHSQLSKALCAT